MTMLKNTHLISASDAAKLLGVTLGRVGQLLREGKLVGERLTPRAWAVDIRSVKKYSKSYRKRGPRPAVMAN